MLHQIDEKCQVGSLSSAKSLTGWTLGFLYLCEVKLVGQSASEFLAQKTLIILRLPIF